MEFKEVEVESMPSSMPSSHQSSVLSRPQQNQVDYFDKLEKDVTNLQTMADQMHKRHKTMEFIQINNWIHDIKGVNRAGADRNNSMKLMMESVNQNKLSLLSSVSCDEQSLVSVEDSMLAFDATGLGGAPDKPTDNFKDIRVSIIENDAS